MAKEFTDANFDELLSSNKVVVADFWATWCGPCKAMGPSIDELAVQYEGQALIGKVDIEENDDLTMKYGIRSVPTTIFFKDGSGNEGSKDTANIMSDACENLNLKIHKENTIIGTSKKYINKCFGSKDLLSNVSRKTIFDAANILMETTNYYDNARL